MSDEQQPNKVANFIDALQKGKNSEAGDMFKDALRDKVASALDTKRVEVAKSIFNGVEAQPHSDDKPNVADPSPETETMIDTQGNEVPTATEAEAPASNESQPTT